MSEEQVSIDSAGVSLRGMLYLPEKEVAAAVVLCNPIFEERKSAHRALVETARALCSSGVSVLRFDYRGCGDSAGEFAAFTLSDWGADIAAATAFLKTKSSCENTGLLGLRLGASLGLVVAGTCGADFVALWEPVVNGREYLDRELRKKLMKEMVTAGKATARRDALVAELDQGGQIDFDGYAVTAALYRELCTLNLLKGEAPSPRRAMVVHVSHQGRPAKTHADLRDVLNRIDCEVVTETVELQPFWNLVGYVDCSSLIRRTETWILAG